MQFLHVKRGYMAGVYTVKQMNSYIKNMFKQDFPVSYTHLDVYKRQGY